MDLVISCDPTRVGVDYAAETASGVLLTDAYAVQRGADKGLVKLMGQGGKRTKTFVIPHRAIQAVVSVKQDMDVLDRADLVFMEKGMTVIHTYTTNAGVFTVSDVYGSDEKTDIAKADISGGSELSAMLEAGLSFYHSAGSKCRKR